MLSKDFGLHPHPLFKQHNLLCSITDIWLRWYWITQSIFDPVGALRYRGGVAPALHISRKKGSFFKTSACPRFCKRRVLFCTQVRSMGSKSPYNPRNIRGSDAEWLPKWLGFRVCCHHLLLLNKQRIIKSKVKIRAPVHPMSVFC